MNKREETCAGIYADITDRALSLSDGLQAVYSEGAVAKDAEWWERVKPLVEALEILSSTGSYTDAGVLIPVGIALFAQQALHLFEQEQPEMEVKP